MAARDGVIANKILDSLKDGNRVCGENDLIKFVGGGESGEKRVNGSSGGDVDALSSSNGVVGVLGGGGRVGATSVDAINISRFISGDVDF